MAVDVCLLNAASPPLFVTVHWIRISVCCRPDLVAETCNAIVVYVIFEFRILKEQTIEKVIWGQSVSLSDGYPHLRLTCRYKMLCAI